MSWIARVSDPLRRWWGERRSPWRTRTGEIIAEPVERGLGLSVRLLLWGLLGLGLFFGAKLLISSVAPAANSGTVEVATPWATLYVACTNPACHASGTSRQPMDFKAWPLTCEKCRQATVHRAKLCPRCRTWIAAAVGAAPPCWRCEELRASTQPKKPPRKPGANPDDDEDGW